MVFPFKNPSDCRVTCVYGKPGSWSSGKHDGVDIVSDGDKTVLSVSNGKVIRAGWNDSWGYYVAVTMADGRSIVYAHMVKGSLKVSVGNAAKAGQAIGTMGNTGNSSGAHLHIELQKSYYKSGAVDDITEFLGIENKVGKVAKIVAELTLSEAKAILKNKAGLNDSTISFLMAYRYGDDLIIKLATAINK